MGPIQPLPDGSNRIIVSGPQRSGTTFFAKALANMLAYRYIDESEFGIHNISKFSEIILYQKKFVMQCPSMMVVLHQFASVPGLFVCVMQRDVEDIVKSQARINWKFEEQEKEKYLEIGLSEKYIFGNKIADIKYSYWESYQKHFFKSNWRYVSYEGLKMLPGWVPKERRVNFKPKQTKEEGK